MATRMAGRRNYCKKKISINLRQHFIFGRRSVGCAPPFVTRSLARWIPKCYFCTLRWLIALVTFVMWVCMRGAGNFLRLIILLIYFVYLVHVPCSLVLRRVRSQWARARARARYAWQYAMAWTKYIPEPLKLNAPNINQFFRRFFLHSPRHLVLIQVNSIEWHMICMINKSTSESSGPSVSQRVKTRTRIPAIVRLKGANTRLFGMRRMTFSS